MRIEEVIARTDELKPNQFSEDIKATWLSELDNRIYNDLISTHVDNPYFTEVMYEEIETEGPDGEKIIEQGEQILVNEEGQTFISFPYTDVSTDLLAPFPYDTLYVNYLNAKIDETTGDTQRYANSYVLFNNAYSDYAKWYNRNHMYDNRRKK